MAVSDGINGHDLWEKSVIKISIEPGFTVTLKIGKSPMFESTVKFATYKSAEKAAEKLQKEMWEDALCTWENIQVWDETKSQSVRLFETRNRNG